MAILIDKLNESVDLLDMISEGIYMNDELLSVTASFGGSIIGEKDSKETIYEKSNKNIVTID